MGVSDTTISSWIGKYPKFEEEIKKAQAEAKVELIEEIRANKHDRNYKVISTFFLLQNNFPNEYGDKRRVEHTGKDGQPILVKVIRYADKKK